MEKNIISIEEIKYEIAKYGNEFSNWFEYFDKESIRACLIIGAERISEHLRVLIQGYFSTKNEHFVLPEELSNRSKIAMKFNIISIELYQIITQIRKIRNLVAHSFGEIDLERNEFVDLIRIIILNIKKLYTWRFLLLIMQEIFFKIAHDKKYEISLNELENGFDKFIYGDKRQLFKFVLMTLIIELDFYKHEKQYEALYGDNLLEFAQKDYDELCDRLILIRSNFK